ncbi:ABC transporter permease subunit [Telmatospirillum sp.]|uniref:ABC transporter permease subunit n=1 Tax=Telmatospirillum sp. TaxID=2079197 RepID=UPI002848DC44|nr:ABC transporter permease subunit [Telmatospirillum sp.]MDR3439836.1 ABC transporter permease subunit [Telmatospirillum sp.]
MRLSPPALASLPLVAFTIAFFVLPVGFLLVSGFYDHGFTLKYFVHAVSVSAYLQAFQNTMVIASLVTILSVVFAYPLAYLLATLRQTIAKILFLVVLLPFWTSALVRTTGWIILLQKNGIVNDLLRGVGLTDQPIAFVFNLTGVLIGMTHVLMPFVVLPLYASFRSVDRSVILAAEGLGASPVRLFWRVMLPLTSPGAIAGAIMVFMNAIGYYITPSLMGGPGQTMIAQMIAFNISEQLNWGLAAALALILLCVTLVLFAIVQKLFNFGEMMSSGSSRAGEPFGAEIRSRSVGGRISAGLGLLVVLFLVAPILLIFPISFGSSTYFTFPPPSYTVKWYANFFSDNKWLRATGNSLVIAALTVVLSAILGTSAAVGVSRLKKRAAGFFDAYFIMPMIVPAIVISVALYYFLAPIGLIGSLWAPALGHTLVATPYVFLSVRAVLRGFDGNLEYAALGLGASWPTMFRRVMLPAIMPGVIGGAVFAFITSFDDVVLALFLTNLKTRTLPKLMYEGVAQDIDPTIVAASCIIIVATLVLLGLNLLASRSSHARVDHR